MKTNDCPNEGVTFSAGTIAKVIVLILLALGSSSLGGKIGGGMTKEDLTRVEKLETQCAIHDVQIRQIQNTIGTINEMNAKLNAISEDVSAIKAEMKYLRGHK